MACANLFHAVGFDLMFPVCYVHVSSVHEVFCPGYLQFLYLHLSLVCLHSNLPLNWWCHTTCSTHPPTASYQCAKLIQEGNKKLLPVLLAATYLLRDHHPNGSCDVHISIHLFLLTTCTNVCLL